MQTAPIVVAFDELPDPFGQMLQAIPEVQAFVLGRASAVGHGVYFRMADHTSTTLRLSD